MLTRKQAAEYLGLKPCTLALWAVNGRPELPYEIIKKRAYYRMDDLEKVKKKWVSQFSSLVSRFNVQYAVAETGCWEWTGTTNSRGYGQITDNYKTRSAHRVSYELHRGAVSRGMQVCHKCDNPPCVNPDHLFVGTAKDNNQDKAGKGRAAKGEGLKINKLVSADVERIREAHSFGAVVKDLAAIYHVASSTIYRVINRQNWRHV